MKTNFVCRITASVATLCVATALATDIPEGGDAMYHQLRASSDVVIANLMTSATGHLFEVVEQIRGVTPRSFYLDDSGQDLHDVLRSGQRYLLFLGRGPGGIPRLAASYYSAQPIAVADTAALLEWSRSYLTLMRDRALLKPLLFKSAISRVPYIQYSSVGDLVNLGLMTLPDVAALARLVDSRQITDARARALLVGEVGRLKATEFVPLLERLATDRAEAMLVRSRSLDALYVLNATAALRNVATKLDQDPSLHLRRKIIEINERPR